MEDPALFIRIYMACEYFGHRLWMALDSSHIASAGASQLGNLYAVSFGKLPKLGDTYAVSH